MQLKHYHLAMPNRKREVISPKQSEIGDGIIKKDGGIIKKDDEIIGDHHLAHSMNHPCFKCDRLNHHAKILGSTNFSRKKMAYQSTQWMKYFRSLLI